MAEEATYQGLIENLEHYLEYQREEGVTRLEVDRSTLVELTKEPEPIPEAPAEPEPTPTEFASLAELDAHLSARQLCPLCGERNHSLPGEGKGDSPEIFFAGEGPGPEQDAQGRPVVSKAGQLLNKMIEAMGYDRREVYVANVIKCPPAGKAGPARGEVGLPFLREQIRLVQPKIIVGLGGAAMEGLLGKPVSIIRTRGAWMEYKGIKLMPTFHPSYLLRDPTKKKDAWADLQLVLAELGKKPPPRK